MKKLLFTVSALFSFYFSAFSQGAPACPSINTGGTTVCQGVCVPLTATVVANNQTTSYSVSAIPYAPYPYSGGTGVSVGTDDVWSPVITLPFNFCFFGASYSQCMIGSNGQISFDLANATFPPGGYDAWSINAAMPNLTDMPGNTICGVFRDIDPAIGGSVYYYISGTSPCRALVVCFDNVPLFDNISATSTCGGTPNSSFQMILYEKTNYIDVYVGNSFSCNTWNGGYGIIGIQNATATTAVCAPGWNYPSTPTGNGIAWRFTPTGAPSYNVTWTAPSGVIGTGLTVNVCPNTTTSYTATMVVTNCDGSQITVSDTAIVSIIPGATLTVNSPTICAGSSVVLSATGGTTYTWSANAGSATTSTVSVSPVTTTVYTVTSAGGGACAPIAISTVTVVPSISVTVNSPPAICSGATTTLTASGAATYTWSPATGLSSTNGATVTANPNTTTTYTVTGSSGTCPTSSAVTTVTVIPSTTITVNSATICPTTSATLTATGSTTYNWSPGTGLSGTSGASVTANPPTTTSYTVSGPVCVTSGTCTVTVIPSCSISVNSAAICPNGTATLTANGGGPYTWSPPTGLNTTVGTTVLANPTSTTSYTVSSTSGGFTSTAVATVVVLAAPAITANNITICEGTTGTLIANGASTYSWSPPLATTASTVAASPTITTAYTVTGTAPNGCTNTAISTVGVNPMPIVSVTPANSTGCAPLCVTYSATSSTTNQISSWNFGDGTTSISYSPTHCFTGEGAYTISLTLTDASGCKGMATSTALVYPMPKADFAANPQPTTILEPNIQFVDLTSGAVANSWIWNFGDLSSADTSGLKNPYYQYKDTGMYVVQMIVSTAFGCKDTAVKIIKIDDDYELFVPTAFTPNADGVNEIFLPVGTGISASSYHLYIFDRWGNTIFQTDNLNKGWDGRKGDEIVQEDMYVWKIVLKTTKGLSKQIHGQVSVVK